MDPIELEELLQRVTDRFEGTVLADAWGERGVFYNPDRRLARGTYFLTVKTHDGPNDTASDLDRDGVYRVNIGISPERYRERFGDPPARPPAGEAVDTGHDFTTLDTLLPHPTYAWANWVCVLSPSADTVEDLWPLIKDAYDRARERFAKRVA